MQPFQLSLISIFEINFQHYNFGSVLNTKKKKNFLINGEDFLKYNYLLLIAPNIPFINFTTMS